VRNSLGGHKNIHLLLRVSYPEFVWLMDRSTMILTESGGVQEEAPSLGKPVLVMRDTTERPEAIEAGVAELVGTSVEKIVGSASALLTDPAECDRRRTLNTHYGDGHAAERIVDLVVNRFGR
jgi:UDP-N-acetylglucosamine 2-epimerase (non-hydrolysing)